MITQFGILWCWMPVQPHRPQATQSTHTQQPTMRKQCVACRYNNQADRAVYGTSSNRLTCFEKTRKPASLTSLCHHRWWKWNHLAMMFSFSRLSFNPNQQKWMNASNCITILLSRLLPCMLDRLGPYWGSNKGLHTFTVKDENTMALVGAQAHLCSAEDTDLRLESDFLPFWHNEDIQTKFIQNVQLNHTNAYSVRQIRPKLGAFVTRETATPSAPQFAPLQEYTQKVNISAVLLKWYWGKLHFNVLVSKYSFK